MSEWAASSPSPSSQINTAATAATTTTTTWKSQTFLPFPKGSLSVLTAPSNSGKSTYIKKLIQNAHLYFPQPFNKIIVVNCHSLVAPYHIENLPNAPWDIPPIHNYLLSDFNPDEILEPDDLLILEDLQDFSPIVRLIVTALVHHRELAACFIVTHSLLSSRHFELLQHTHRVILFLQSAATTRLALYIVRHFFVDPELKTYLKSILGVAEKQRAVLHIEINPIAGERTAHHLALSHLLSLSVDKEEFAILYPYPATMTFYQDIEQSSPNSEVESLSGDLVNNLPEVLHPDSYVLLNAKHVQQWKKLQVNSKESLDCAQDAGKDEWNEAVLALEESIDDAVPTNKLFKAKSLCKEMLKNPQFCLSSDGRSMSVTDKPNLTFNVVDYILCAIRNAGPNEMSKINEGQYKLYRIVTKILLNRNAPTQMFRNKVLLASPSVAAKVRRQNPHTPSNNRHKVSAVKNAKVLAPGSNRMSGWGGLNLYKS